MSTSRCPVRFVRTRRCRLELLEDRRLLTAYLVDSLADIVAADGHVTLREALEAANTNAPVFDAPAGSDTETDAITFSPDLFTDGENPTPGTITLGGTQLTIADDLNIQGPGDMLLSVDADRLSRVFYVKDGVTARLSDLCITGGSVADSWFGGGGIYNAGTLTIMQCTIAKNTVTAVSATESAWALGGGIHNAEMLTIARCTIAQNTATIADTTRGIAGGGGICNTNAGTLAIDDSFVQRNVATAGSSGQPALGGGIASYFGGNAITVTRSVLSDNSACAASSFGGAICSTCALTVTSSIVTRNFATGNGTISMGFGGGIFVSTGDLLTLMDSTITGNWATNFAGGIDAHDRRDRDQLNRCSQRAPSAPNIWGTPSAASGFNLIDTDPGFTVNPGAGEDGVWGTIDDVLGDLCLRSDSPAVDAGSNELAVDAEGQPLLTDVDGLSRIVGEVVDIGASEYRAIHALVEEFEGLASAEPHVLDLVANDEYPIGAEVTVEIVTAPDWGTAVLNPDGTVTYTSDPHPGFDTFRYRLLVDGEPTNTAEVRVRLGGPFVVSTDSDDVDDDYSPGNLSLREALVLAAATPGTDVITFDESLCGTRITLSSGQLVIDSPVEIRGPGADQLTIDANAQSRIFYVGVDVTATISGLQITGGRVVYNSDDVSTGQGGGILSAGTLTIADCMVCGNFAGLMGGAVFDDNGDADVRQFDGIGQFRGFLGGGIFSEGTAIITNSTIADNSASSIPGGGVCSSGTAVITNSAIVNNSSAVLRRRHQCLRFYDGYRLAHLGQPGVRRIRRGRRRIYISGGATLLTNSVISHNSVTGSSSGYGGGIYCNGSTATLTVNDSTIAGNWAKTAGGGIHGATGTRTLTNSIVALNSAASDPNVSGLLSEASQFNLIDADPLFALAPARETTASGAPRTTCSGISGRGRTARQSTPAATIWPWTRRAFHCRPTSRGSRGSSMSASTLARIEYSPVHATPDRYEGLDAAEPHVLDLLANDVYPAGAAVTVEILRGTRVGHCHGEPRRHGHLHAALLLPPLGRTALSPRCRRRAHPLDDRGDSSCWAAMLSRRPSTNSRRRLRSGEPQPPRGVGLGGASCRRRRHHFCTESRGRVHHVAARPIGHR